MPSLTVILRLFFSPPVKLPGSLSRQVCRTEDAGACIPVAPALTAGAVPPDLVFSAQYKLQAAAAPQMDQTETSLGALNCHRCRHWACCRPLLASCSDILSRLELCTHASLGSTASACWPPTARLVFVPSFLRVPSLDRSCNAHSSTGSSLCTLRLSVWKDWLRQKS